METRKIGYHSRYLDEAATYKQIDDWYDGRLSRVVQYLIPHHCESANTPEAQRVWADRRKRTTNENEMKPAVKIHVGHLAQPIDFGLFGESDVLKPVIANADGYGRTPKKMLQKMLTQYILHGFVGVYVEGPDIKSVGEETRADAMESKTQSRQMVFSASQLRGWSYFDEGPRAGQLASVLVARGFVKVDKREGERLDLFEIDNRAASTFVRTELFVPKDTETGEDGLIEAIILNVIEGSLDSIPVVLCGDGLDSTVTSDAAQTHHALFNQVSILDSINYYQGFKWNIITGATVDDIASRAEYQVTLLRNENASVHSVEAGDPVSIAQRIDGLRYRLRRQMMFDMNALTNDASKQVQSAESKDHDVRSREEVYNAILNEFETVLTKVFQLHAVYEGSPDLAKNEDAAIKIGRDFKLGDPAASQAQRGMLFSQASQLGAFEVQKAILRQNTVASLEKSLPETELQILLSSIDALSPARGGSVLDSYGSRGGLFGGLS